MMSFSRKPKIWLSALVEGLNMSKKCPRLAIEGLALDSRDIRPGYVFFALKGLNKDGAAYVSQAIECGAVAVITEWTDIGDDSVTSIFEGFRSSVPILKVKNLSEEVSEIAGRFYDHPSHKTKVTAVTGTNGKTTCAHLYSDLWTQFYTRSKTLQDDNYCGYIGTLGHGIAALDDKMPLQNRPKLESSSSILVSPLTTPDAIDMQTIFANFASKGCSGVVLEASSHALVQNRIASISLDTAIFTNLSRDHLDYHGDLESYADAKRKLFSYPALKNAVINIDDAIGKSILVDLDPSIRPVTYSLENITADIYCQSMRFSAKGLEADIQTPWGSGRITSSLLGKFNLYNLLAVIAAFVIHDTRAEYENFVVALELVKNLSAVNGRMELVDSLSGPTVIVDYAHTPDALDQALQALRLHSEGAVWVVFGCGGDRDIGKRAEMGHIAADNADYVVVTSDNPRNESPDKIIQDIVSVTTDSVIIEPNRGNAINFAISSAANNDVVLIAGKGHESYQILGNQRVTFSDQVEARLALKSRHDKMAVSI
jgi:UDP-N-acetylmuramoyl-L-alanyl-D-glutamate--2,6-diaminopimelate ligase